MSLLAGCAGGQRAESSEPAPHLENRANDPAVAAESLATYARWAEAHPSVELVRNFAAPYSSCERHMNLGIGLLEKLGTRMLVTDHQPPTFTVASHADDDAVIDMHLAPQSRRFVDQHGDVLHTADSTAPTTESMHMHRNPDGRWLVTDWNTPLS